MARGGRPSLTSRVLLALGAVALALAVCEGGLRVYHAVKVARWKSSLPPLAERAIIPSEDPRLGFEFNPGWNADGFSVNSHGMLQREVALEKAPGTLRIALVGDSITAGFRLAPAHTLYGARLEALLNAAAGLGERRAEVLNFAVNAYSGEQSLQMARTRIARFSPDVLVAQLCLNDPYPSQVGYTADRAAYPLRLIDFAMRRAAPDRFWARFHVSGRYDAAGWTAMRRSLEGFAALGRERPTLAVLFPYLSARAYERWGFGEIHAGLAQVAGEAGLEWLDLYALFSRAGLLDRSWPADAVHPGPEGHELAAEAIAAALEERGWR